MENNKFDFLLGIYINIFEFIYYVTMRMGEKLSY